NRSLDPGPRYAPRDDTAVSNRGEAKASCSWTAVSLDELCIYDRVEIRLCLDESNFQEKIRRFLAESLDLAIEETLVRFSILPSQVRCRIGELLCALFDVGTHDLVALLRFFLDHIDRVEVACHHFLDRPGIFLDEFGRATKGVHDHRIVERGGDDLSYRRILAHFGKIRFVGHRGIVLTRNERLRGLLRGQRRSFYILYRQPVFLEDPCKPEIGRCSGRIDVDGLP